jgi:hypothetical protein
MDVADGGGKITRKENLNGTPLQIYDCLPNENQVFHLDQDTHLMWKDKCVDPVNLKTDNGTKLQLYDCNDGNKGWKYEGNSLTWNGKCLDLGNGDETNSKHLQLWQCDPTTNNQKWKIQTP